MAWEQVSAFEAMTDDQPVQDIEETRQIGLARTGNAAAISWLLDRYRDRVVRLAAHILRAPADAEDAAQEAYIKAFRSLDSFRGSGKFYTWLYRIVVRVCLDYRRLARWQSEVTFDAVPESRLAQESGVGAAESRILVEALLDQLTLVNRAVLVLRELEDLEYEEIAKVMNIPVGRVKWRLHTARAAFEKLARAAMTEASDGSAA